MNIIFLCFVFVVFLYASKGHCGEGKKSISETSIVSLAEKENSAMMVLATPKAVGQGDNEERVALFKRHREKRFLLQPNGGLYKLVLSIAFPIEVRFKRSLVMAVNFQWQYPGFTTIEQLKKPYPPIIAKSESKRSISDRELFYLGIEATLKKQGFSGRSCLLRMICENSFNSYSIEENAVLGQLLHIILTPINNNEITTFMNQDYIEAQTAGNFGVDCQSLHPQCKHFNSIFDFNKMFTHFYKIIQ